MTKKKRKYFPNNWEEYNGTPADFFEAIPFDVFMDWKIGGYEIPSSIAAVIRVKDLNTGKVKEHVYRYRHAARNKCKKLMKQGDKEITVVQRDTVHFLTPKEHDIFDDY